MYIFCSTGYIIYALLAIFTCLQCRKETYQQHCIVRYLQNLLKVFGNQYTHPFHTRTKDSIFEFIGFVCGRLQYNLMILRIYILQTSWNDTTVLSSMKFTHTIWSANSLLILSRVCPGTLLSCLTLGGFKVKV